MGPKAKPRTNKPVPRVVTSRGTPNSLAVTPVAVLKTLLAKVTTKVIEPSKTAKTHFFQGGMF